MTVVLFRNRLRPEATDAYAELAPQLAALAQQQPGFIAMKTFTAADGERVTIAEFESDDAVAAWRAHAEHRVAQKRGRDELYSEYRLQVCEVVRERTFP